MPVPTSPFDEVNETDAFMLFPELQHPYSALREGHPAYNVAMETVKAAEERASYNNYRARDRGSPVDRKDMVLRALQQGPYESWRTPSRRKKHSALFKEDQPASECYGSPMDLD